MNVLSELIELSQPRIRFDDGMLLLRNEAMFFAGNAINAHFVASGECELRLDEAGTKPSILKTGDFLILSKKQNHWLQAYSQSQISIKCRLEYPVRVINGKLLGEEFYTKVLQNFLPDILVNNIFAQDSIQIFKQCVQHNGCIGDKDVSRHLLEKLSDFLVLSEVQKGFNSLPEDVHRWNVTSSDPLVGRALQLIHNDPVAKWTTHGLARSVGMSRSAFLKRFKIKVGQPPLHYIVKQRMQIATDSLRSGHIRLGEVVQKAGYASEAAFCKAFHREVGVSPAAYRDASAKAKVEMQNLGPSGSFATPAYHQINPDLRRALINLVLETEALMPAAACAILLLDGTEQKLRVGASPSLPEAYNSTIDGIRIGPNAGSCGTAAFRKASVITPDVFASEQWTDYRYLAERFNLKSCWSVPVFDDHNVVLGTVALYYRQCHWPSTIEIDLVQHLIGKVKASIQFFSR